MSGDLASLEHYRDGLVETVREVGAQAALDFDTAWADAAASAIADLADRGVEFDAEDLRRAVGDPPASGAIGASFLRASRAGLIECLGMHKSTRLAAHGRWVRVWRGRRNAHEP